MHSSRSMPACTCAPGGETRPLPASICSLSFQQGSSGKFAPVSTAAQWSKQPAPTQALLAKRHSTSQLRVRTAVSASLPASGAHRRAGDVGGHTRSPVWASHAQLNKQILGTSSCEELRRLVLRLSPGDANEVNTFSAVTHLHRLLRPHASNQDQDGEQEATKPGQTSPRMHSKTEMQAACQLLPWLVQLGLQHKGAFTARHAVAMLTSMAWLCKSFPAVNAVVDGSAHGTTASQAAYSELSLLSPDRWRAFLDCLCATVADHAEALADDRAASSADRGRQSADQAKTTRHRAESSSGLAPGDVSRAMWAAARLNHYHPGLVKASAAHMYRLLSSSVDAAALLGEAPAAYDGGPQQHWGAPRGGPTVNGRQAKDAPRQDGTGRAFDQGRPQPQELGRALSSLLWSLGQLTPLSSSHSQANQEVWKLVDLVYTHAEQRQGWLGAVCSSPEELSTLLHGLASLDPAQEEEAGREASSNSSDGAGSAVPLPRPSPAVLTALSSAVSAAAAQLAAAAPQGRPAPHRNWHGAQAVSNLAWALGKLHASAEGQGSWALGGTGVQSQPEAAGPARSGSLMPLCEAVAHAQQELARAALAAGLQQFKPQEVANLVGAVAQAHVHLVQDPQEEGEEGPGGLVVGVRGSSSSIRGPVGAASTSESLPPVVLQLMQACAAWLLQEEGPGQATRHRQGQQAHSVQRVQQLQSHDLCELLVAFATLGYTGSAGASPTGPAGLGQELGQAVALLAQQAEPAATAGAVPISRIPTLLWAMARCGHAPHALLSHLESACLAAQEELWGGSSTATSNRSNTSTENSSFPAPPPPLDLLEDLTPQELSKLCWALAHLSKAHPGASLAGACPTLLQQCEAAAAAQVADLDSHSLTILLWAFASLEQPCTELLEAAAPVLLQRCTAGLAVQGGTVGGAGGGGMGNSPRLGRSPASPAVGRTAAGGSAPAGGLLRPLQVKPGAVRTSAVPATPSVHPAAASTEKQPPAAPAQALTPHQLALCLWAVARMLEASSSQEAVLRGMSPLRLLRSAATAVEAVAGQLGPRALARVAWAYASAQVNPGDRMLRALAVRAAALAPALSPQAISMLAWSLSQFKVLAPKLYARLADEMVARVAQYSTVQPQLPSSQLALQGQALPQQPQLPMQALCNTAVALARTGVYRPQLLDAALAAAAASVMQAQQEQPAIGADIASRGSGSKAASSMPAGVATVPVSIATLMAPTPPLRPNPGSSASSSSSAKKRLKLQLKSKQQKSEGAKAGADVGGQGEGGAKAPARQKQPARQNSIACSASALGKQDAGSSVDDADSLSLFELPQLGVEDEGGLGEQPGGPTSRELAPLLWALAHAQHPCPAPALDTLITALQAELRHSKQRSPRQLQQQGTSVRSTAVQAPAVQSTAVDPGLVVMALGACAGLRYQPPKTFLAAACGALYGRAGAGLSTHSVVEVLAALAELQYPPPGPLLRELVGAVEVRVVGSRQEILTLATTVKLAWALAVLRQYRSPAFRFAAPRALGSRPEALNAQPSLLRRLVELKLLVQAERTAGGYWRALRRRWEARVEAGGADALPPGLAVQGLGMRSSGGGSGRGAASLGSSSSASMVRMRDQLIALLHGPGLGCEDARWKALPQGDEACVLTLALPSGTPRGATAGSGPAAGSASDAAASSLSSVDADGLAAAVDALTGQNKGGKRQRVAVGKRKGKKGRGKGERTPAHVKVAITLIGPAHLSLNEVVGGEAGMLGFPAPPTAAPHPAPSAVHSEQESSSTASTNGSGTSAFTGSGQQRAAGTWAVTVLQLPQAGAGAAAGRWAPGNQVPAVGLESVDDEGGAGGVGVAEGGAGAKVKAGAEEGIAVLERVPTAWPAVRDRVLRRQGFWVLRLRLAYWLQLGPAQQEQVLGQVLGQVRVRAVAAAARG